MRRDEESTRAGEARLPAATHVGPVQLQVADLERSVRFYEGVLGLGQLYGGTGRARAAGDATVTLGVPGAGRVLVELVERAGARAADPARPRLGLYHFAILLPDRASLGRFLGHAAELGIRLGAGDHLVSEALYLSDPDGLGIEVYADRPRSTWRRQDGQLVMATDPVDFQGLLAAGGGRPWQGVPADTVMGHVHLHVGNLQQARSFYVDALGLDVVTDRYPGALFMAAGDYHHHLGTNTWARGGTVPAEGDARLLEWTLDVPGSAAVAAVAERMQQAGAVVTKEGDDVLVTDPWHTRLRIGQRSG